MSSTRGKAGSSFLFLSSRLVFFPKTLTLLCLLFFFSLCVPLLVDPAAPAKPRAKSTAPKRFARKTKERRHKKKRKKKDDDDGNVVCSSLFAFRVQDNTRHKRDKRTCLLTRWENKKTNNTNTTQTAPQSQKLPQQQQQRQQRVLPRRPSLDRRATRRNPERQRRDQGRQRILQLHPEQGNKDHRHNKNKTLNRAWC